MEMSIYMVGYRGIFSASKGQIISEGNYALLKFSPKNPHNNFVVFLENLWHHNFLLRFFYLFSKLESGKSWLDFK